MKNILLVLLVSVLLIGCSENRVVVDQLINKRSRSSPLMYYESGLFNGIGYDVYSNGKLRLEIKYKDGVGIKRTLWNPNGEIIEENYLDKGENKSKYED